MAFVGVFAAALALGCGAWFYAGWEGVAVFLFGWFAFGWFADAAMELYWVWRDE